MRLLTKDIIIGRLSDRKIIMAGEYTNSRTKSLFRCDQNHEWLARPKNILGGDGCPQCAHNWPLDMKAINHRIYDRGIEIIGEYKTTSIKTLFKCKCGYKWDSTPNNILKGNGCPSCSSYGFNPDKSATSYIIDFGTFIKIGITNNLKRRLLRHLNNNGHHTLLGHKDWLIGHDALQWENDIKNKFVGRFVSKSICPDGWTETFHPSLKETLLSTLTDRASL